MDDSHASLAVEMDLLAEGAEAEGARRATAAFGPSVTSRATDPDPEVPAKAQRRRFPAEYRLRILTQADPARSPASWAPCCVARGCTRPCSPTGVGSASRAPCRTCADAGEDPSRGRLTRA